MTAPPQKTLARRLTAQTAATAATVASALLFIVAFPPLHLRALAWVALVPFLLAVRNASVPRAAALAALWGMIAAYGVTDWLPSTLVRYYGQPLWVGAAVFAGGAFFMGALEYMAFALLYRWAARRRVTPLPIIVAGAWVLAELGRSRLLTGNPWGLLGSTQMGLSIPVIGSDVLADGLASFVAARVVQVADIGGIYAVGFVLVVANVALAELAYAAYRATAHRRAIVGAVTGAFVVALAILYGHERLNTSFAPVGPPVPVAVVQGNIDLGARWSDEFYGRNLDHYLRLTDQVAHDMPGGLVVWPENAMTFFVADEELYRRAIARVTSPLDVELLAGAPRLHSAPEPQYFNSAFLLNPDGSVHAHYDKRQLLPFAEYFPFSSASVLARNFARVSEFSPGAPVPPLPTRAGRAAVAICNEAMFAHIVAERVAAGAELLINLSNESWVESAEFAEHQFNLVAIRAIEQRRFMVRASTSGPSAIVDPYGRVVARTAPFTQAVLRGEVTGLSETTFYARHGDAFVVSIIVALIGLVGIFEVRRRPFPGDH